MEGVKKKTTKHVVIEINEDEDTTDAAVDTSRVESTPAPSHKLNTTSNAEVLPNEQADSPIETTDPTNQDPSQDIKNDNPYNKEDEDNTDDFDSNDMELV
ncbi:MAG: hypothetical protein FWC73_11730 [Defluviitaleaceae bacterium]|nr:hypothetical protein [Defluviitaleaceae bacterium]